MPSIEVLVLFLGSTRTGYHGWMLKTHSFPHLNLECFCSISQHSRAIVCLWKTEWVWVWQNDWM